MKIIMNNQMNLATKEEQFNEIQQLIELKRKMLLDKQSKYKNPNTALFIFFI